MRKANGIITVMILILFVYHMIGGILQLTGLIKGGNPLFIYPAFVMIALVILHVIFGIKLTIDTMIAAKKTGVSYWKDNGLFWLRRISGFALFLFMGCHVLLFAGIGGGGIYRLRYFNVFALLTQILMVLSLALHVMTNIPPLRISLGLTDRRNFRMDLLIVLGILLFMAGASFFIYFIRWCMV